MEEIHRKTKEAEEKNTMSWRRYERRKAREHRAKHIGGPGNEDYRRGDVKGEVKHRKQPLTKPEVKKLAKRGIKEVSSLGGFTKPAREYVKRYRPNMKLFHKGRCVA